MIEQQAQVVAIDNTEVTVESLVSSSCSGCKQVESCGSGQIAKAFPQKKLKVTLQTELPVKIGDFVMLGLSEEILLKSAWQVYIWPLIGMIFGGFLGQWLLEQNHLVSEIFAIAISLSGGLLGFYFARNQQNKLANCPQWAPVIMKVLPENIQINQTN